MRMKHGSDRGPTISMKPRLLAAFTAVAMMFATAVPALMPAREAYAADPTDLGPGDSGFYKPGNIQLGDDMSDLTIDTGVATWVGRDMYVGGRPAGSNLTLNGDKSGGADGRGFYNYTNAPTASYAAEAEGLTIVKGKLAINQVKDSWSTSIWNNAGARTKFSGGQGFRFGIAGFGAQFRPESGSTALVVAGEGSNISSMTTGGQTGNVGAWNHNGWVGVTAKWDGADKWNAVTGEASYTAQLSGNKTFSQGYVDGYQPRIGTFPGTYKHGNRDSIGGNQGAWAGDGLVTWNAQSPLNSVNGTNRSKYTEKIQSDSTTFQNLGSTGNVTVGTADAGSATYYRYSYDNNGISYTFNWENNGLKSEKLLTFTGDGTSNLQVFNIKNTDLTHDSQGGIDFKFTNIPKDASIVINVTGGNVRFNTGWRFWWDYIDENGHKETLQIGNGYYLNGDDKIQKAYVQAARSIMWNFADANLVTINGGQYYAGSTGTAGRDDGKFGDDWGYIACGSGQETNFNKGCAGDDPAAAMLGSILVPNGSFDSHVTTNGRVWVGEDFMMNNPKGAAYFNKIEGVSSSVLDMDQERHNLPWTGSVSTEASVIQWQKSNGSALLPGSSWKLYRNLEDAKAQRNPITTVTDNGTGDWNMTKGVISVTGLVPDKNYYLRENGHVQDHEPNNNIYLIQTSHSGDTPNTTIAKVWDQNGNPINGSNADKDLTEDGAIVNTPVNSGTEIKWGKYAEGDTSHTPLPGSSWQISSDGGQTWTVIDDVTAGVEGIEIKNAEGVNVTGQNIGTVSSPSTLKFSTSVTPEGAPNGVHWSSDQPSLAVVEQDGTVSVRDGDGTTVVTLTATSTSNPSITATVSFTPLAPNVDSVEIYKSGETQPATSIDLTVGNSVKLEAVVRPAGSATWSTDNAHVTLTTNADGTVTVTGNTVGTSTVTATAGGKQASVTVNVTEDTTRTAVYILWPSVNSVTFKANGGVVQAEKVQSCTSSGNWFVGYVYKNRQQFTITDLQSDKGTYGIKSGSTVTAGAASWKIEAGNGSAGAPSCATQGDVSNPNGPSAFADDVAVADDAPAAAALPEVHAEGDSNAARSSTLQDADSAPGRFKLENLPNGTYKLKEHTAPEGFTLNPQVYTITITDGQNGQKVVTWDPNHVDANGVAWISDTPTEVEWNKVDAQNTKQPLGGAVWKLESFSNGGYAEYNGEGNGTVTDCTENCTADPDNPLQDINPDRGMIKLQQLPVGRYRIQEKTPPSGYDAPENTYYYFELEATPNGTVKIYKGTGSFDTTTGAPTGEGVVEVSYNNITNPRKTGKVYWGKVSSEDDTRFLAGSAWKVTYIPYGGTEANKIEVDITDCVGTTGTCSAADAKKAPWAYDVYTAEGRIGFDNLPWGSYEMIETKAPDGYYANPDAVYVFTVGPDTPEFQNVVIYKKNADGTTGDAIPAPTTPLPNYPNQVISNEPGVILPATGGEGNTRIVLFGFALIAISMLGCGVAMRKRI